MPSGSTSATFAASWSVAERPAVDASPLIFLTRARLVELLRLVAPRIVVPSTVMAELERRGPEDPTVRTVTEAEWLRVVEAPSATADILDWDLGPGETSVLAWCAAKPGTEAILDDLVARRCAQSTGIPVRGTLGLVLLGKKQGVLPAARPVLEELRDSGMYLSDRILDRALRWVGE